MKKKIKGKQLYLSQNTKTVIKGIKDVSYYHTRQIEKETQYKGQFGSRNC